MEDIILREVERLQADLLKAIEELVAVPSVWQKKAARAPYGLAVKEALVKALAISKELGLQTKNVHHHIGYAYDKAGEDYVGVFGHLDVVAADGVWQFPPFSVTYHHQRMYGRGVLDNKGPLMAALFAFKALKNAGVPLQHPIRIVFGCNEESGMKDIEVYKRFEPLPVCGFTPDCKYPVVYSERGRCVFELSGTNAKMMRFLNQYVLGSYDIARRLAVDDKTEEYGRVEIKGAKLLTKNGRTCLHAAIVYPYGIHIEEIEQRICQKLETGITYARLENTLPMHHDPNETMIQLMAKAYHYVTHMDSTPVTTTGGTYAKVLPGIVPFGPSFPGQKGISHLPDEWMNIDDLMTNCKIYALSLYYLANSF